MLIPILIILILAVILPFIIYYIWIKEKSTIKWGLNINKEYTPYVTLIIPTYNESSVIESKIQNTNTINYPENRLQIILIDSASTDNTYQICKNYINNNKMRFSIKLIHEQDRQGKSHALNTALKYAKGEIIATSDADSYWEPSTLRNAIKFFSDPSIGAVTGREEIRNLEESIHTESEGLYRKFYYILRLGESKIHSTLIFQGESLYRRSAFHLFEDKPGHSDDTGTVINIISNGYRCIFTPEAIFHDTAARSLQGKISLKSRRAQHLIAGFLHAASLKITGKLPIPLSIVLFNLFMHILSPILLSIGIIVGMVTMITYFEYMWIFLLIMLTFLSIRTLRLMTISYLSSNISLLIGFFRHIFGKRERSWQKIEEMRP